MDTRIPKAEFDAMLAEAAKEQATKTTPHPQLPKPSLYDTLVVMVKTLLRNVTLTVRGDVSKLDTNYPLFQVGALMLIVGVALMARQ